ncbi:hypothetical protein NDU88_001953 [Pleurodeles waltl]|uniref:Uncharacterized protein n=1 Tax=Pleurodeles waltl TaxID=8319 RepID=A0AAV7W2K1_PLEWA|nr:hypothetical protein NDU88_001953 [Pleurodeles waltl]
MQSPRIGAGLPGGRELRETQDGGRDRRDRAGSSSRGGCGLRPLPPCKPPKIAQGVSREVTLARSGRRQGPSGARRSR